jgi:hypothetical protein
VLRPVGGWYCNLMIDLIDINICMRYIIEHYSYLYNMHRIERIIVISRLYLSVILSYPGSIPKFHSSTYSRSRQPGWHISRCFSSSSSSSSSSFFAWIYYDIDADKRWPTCSGIMDGILKYFLFKNILKYIFYF